MIVSLTLDLDVCFNLQVVGPMVQQQITNVLHILINIVFPTWTIEHTFHAMQQGVRKPYHTSILSGQAWVQELLQELLHGHPRRILGAS